MQSDTQKIFSFVNSQIASLGYRLMLDKISSIIFIERLAIKFYG